MRSRAPPRSQFEHAEIVYHRWSLIRTRFQLHRVLEGSSTSRDRCCPPWSIGRCAASWRRTCRRLNVPVVNVLDPVMNLLQEYIGEQAAARPGRQYVLNADYFRRIDAMHYVLAHDDGQAQPGMAEADVVLVGRLAQLEDADLLLSGQSRHQGGQCSAGAEPAGAARTGDRAVPGDRPDAGCRRADRDPPPSAAPDRRRPIRPASCGRTAPNMSTRTR